MYKSATLASLALMATSALAGSPGQAIVVNQCSYPVYVFNTPSSDGVHSEIDKTLQPGDSYSQTYTQLANGNGWSIKLSKVDAPPQSNILQYEYTYHNDGIIWYDLSAVNGNPWAGDWQVSSASSGCSPRQTWYRYDTDDAFGMQDCPDSSSITVTLCPSSGGSSAGSVVSSVVAALTSAVPVFQTPTTTAVHTTAQTTAAHTDAPAAPTHAEHTDAPAAPSSQPLATGKALGFNEGHFVNAAVVNDAVSSAAPTTTATPTTFATHAAGVTPVVAAGNEDVVTQIVTVVETAIAYETYVPGKRHVHHPNHPQFR